MKTGRATRREPDLELADALNRSIAGDSDAFAQLYRSTSPRVYGVVCRVLKCPDQAAEVTQEIYLEVWRQAVRYDCTKGGVMTWMTTIAHRRAVDRVRHVSSTRARDQHYATETVEPQGDDVWDSVASRVDAAHVRTALARLAPIYQQTLGLAYFGGRTQSQIAATLDLPLGTVKTPRPERPDRAARRAPDRLTGPGVAGQAQLILDTANSSASRPSPRPA